MNNEIKEKKALETFNSLCDFLDQIKFKYEKHENDLVITFSMSGDDIPMSFVIIVDKERELIRLFSRMPFEMPKERIIDAAVITSYINYKLVDGSFDLDITNGKIHYRMTSSFKDSLIGKELFFYMIRVAGDMVDEFNDKLLMLAKNRITVADLIKEIDK